MTKHVSITEAGARLPELVAAAWGGEDIVLSGLGEAQVRLVPVYAIPRDGPQTRSERRRAALERFAHRAGGVNFGIEPSMTDEEIDERWNRKFGPAA